MKQITHTIDNKEYIFIEVPKDAHDFKLSNNRHVGKTTIYFWTSLIRKHHDSTECLSKEGWDIKEDKFRIISEEDAENLVEFE